MVHFFDRHALDRFAEHALQLFHGARRCEELEAPWIDFDKFDAVAGLDLEGLTNVGRYRDLALADDGRSGHGGELPLFLTPL